MAGMGNCPEVVDFREALQEGEPREEAVEALAVRAVEARVVEAEAEEAVVLGVGVAAEEALKATMARRGD
jgi:hypothetical protein